MNTGVYAASKAAVTMISETLRLELAPFGVKVVTVCTGLVSSNTLATRQNFQLPPTSQYLSIEKEIAARARGDDGFTRMDTSIYAEKVVSDVLGGANGQVWRGTFASINRFMSSWFPSLLVSPSRSYSTTMSKKRLTI